MWCWVRSSWGGLRRLCRWRKWLVIGLARSRWRRLTLSAERSVSMGSTVGQAERRAALSWNTFRSHSSSMPGNRLRTRIASTKPYGALGKSLPKRMRSPYRRSRPYSAGGNGIVSSTDDVNAIVVSDPGGGSSPRRDVDLQPFRDKATAATRDIVLWRRDVSLSVAQTRAKRSLWCAAVVPSRPYSAVSWVVAVNPSWVERRHRSAV